MAIGQGGASPKDGVFAPAPLGFVLPNPCMMGKIFLTHPCPLGPCKALSQPVTLLLVNLSTTITIVFNKIYFINKNILEITNKFIPSNQTNF